jgi:hypothetical protein
MESVNVLKGTNAASLVRMLTEHSHIVHVDIVHCSAQKEPERLTKALINNSAPSSDIQGVIADKMETWNCN